MYRNPKSNSCNRRTHHRIEVSSRGSSRNIYSTFLAIMTVCEIYGLLHFIFSSVAGLM